MTEEGCQASSRSRNMRARDVKETFETQLVEEMSGRWFVDLCAYVMRRSPILPVTLAVFEGVQRHEAVGRIGGGRKEKTLRARVPNNCQTLKYSVGRGTTEGGTTGRNVERPRR